MITPNDNINDNTLNVIFFEGQNVITFKCRGYYHFSGVNVIIFEGLDVIIFKCRGCYNFSWCSAQTRTEYRVTWETPSSEAFVPLQEPVAVLASNVPNANAGMKRNKCGCTPTTFISRWT